VECERLFLRVRALVHPASLTKLKEQARDGGYLRLTGHDELHVEVDAGPGVGDLRPCLSFIDRDARAPSFNAVIEWNVMHGSLVAYADDEILNKVGGAIHKALNDSDAYTLLDKVEFRSVQLGGILVIFEREEKEEAEPEDDPAPRRRYDYVADPDLKEPLGATIRLGQPFGPRGRS
jgi:hypothetical protein